MCHGISMGAEQDQNDDEVVAVPDGLHPPLVYLPEAHRVCGHQAVRAVPEDRWAVVLPVFLPRDGQSHVSPLHSVPSSFVFLPHEHG